MTEIDPICALQACMEGYQVCTMEDCIAAGVDIVITTTGNKDIITLEHMSKMKNNAIVGNIGHFDNEIQMEKLEKATKRMNIKPQVRQVHLPRRPRRHHPRRGPPAQPGLRDGPPVVRHVQLVHQPDARADRAPQGVRGGRQGQDEEKYQNKVYLLPKELDEKVARLHLRQLGANLTDAQQGPGRLHRRLRRRPVQAAHLPLLDTLTGLASAAVHGRGRRSLVSK